MKASERSRRFREQDRERSRARASRAATLIWVGLGLLGLAAVGFVIAVAAAFSRRGAGWEDTLALLSIAMAVFGAILSLSSLFVVMSGRD